MPLCTLEEGEEWCAYTCLSSNCELKDGCKNNNIPTNSQKVRAQNSGSVLPTHVQDVGEFHAKLPNNPAEMGVLSEQVLPPFSVFIAICVRVGMYLHNLHFILYLVSPMINVKG